MTRIWKVLCSMHLALVLCLLLALDAAWGYACIKWQTALFIPLNDMGLVPWAKSWGTSNLALTGWFFLLLPLLALLALNTAACTLERLRQLWLVRTGLGAGRFLLKLGPHVMHLAVLFILLGYLASYLLAQSETAVLLPGRALTLPDRQTVVSFVEFRHQPYTGARLERFQNEVIQPKALLRITDPSGERETFLGFNRPVCAAGWSLHLEDFAPKYEGGMGLAARIDLKMRKDPGVPLYFAGIALFCLGLALYALEQCGQRDRTEEEGCSGSRSRQLGGLGTP